MIQYHKEFIQTKQLLYRAGFGPGLDVINSYAQLNYISSVQKLMADSKSYRAIIWNGKDNDILDQMVFGASNGNRRVRIKNRVAKEKINFRWLQQMIHSPAQLREKMALFWHDHFAASGNSPALTLNYINSIRFHALGNFKDLLYAVAKDGLMISYLNNKQNRKDHPNENFAREVCELFTLGIGHYSEKDVLEAAKAFTGWGLDRKGSFKFVKAKHDKGKKTFLGKSGNFNGEDILHILLDHPQTSYYITGKIYKYLTGITADELTLDRLAVGFYSNGYEISWLVEKILMMNEFKLSKNAGQVIKSPIELIVNICRILGLVPKNHDKIFTLQMRLKQALLYPPNVSGWPSGKSWIDLESISQRLDLASTLLSNKQIRFNKVALSLEGDENENTNQASDKLQLNHLFYQQLFSQDKAQALAYLRVVLFNCPNKHLDKLFKECSLEIQNNPASLEAILLRLLSQPEYQVH